MKQRLCGFEHGLGLAVAEDIPGVTAAFAALAGHPQLPAQLAQGAFAGSGGGANLAVGNTLAKADVHTEYRWLWWLTGFMLVIMRIYVNNF